MSNEDYISRLKAAIEDEHQCIAIHKESVFVNEEVRPDVCWQGYGEVFDLRGHPRSNRGYGWGVGQTEHLVTVVDSRPAIDPIEAVRIGQAQQNIRRWKIFNRD